LRVYLIRIFFFGVFVGHGGGKSGYKLILLHEGKGLDDGVSGIGVWGIGNLMFM
jgi:hypothetical protein